jgi:hypothetical protein
MLVMRKRDATRRQCYKNEKDILLFENTEVGEKLEKDSKN